MTERLDAALAAQGLARSRSHASTLIAAGVVRVDGAAVIKASTRVHPGQTITLDEADHYVSRGARKLIAALDGFPVTVAGKLALDAGASTGGFTQVLLERGARAVVAADVGHDQLAPLLVADPRVVNVEGINLRTVTPDELAKRSGISEAPEIVVVDLSFISLDLVLPALVTASAANADFLVLVKPQFEVGRGGIREGVVRDPLLRVDAVCGVLWSAWDAGIGTAGILPSPILGGAGNHEYLVWFSAASGTNPSVWLDRVAELAGASG